jgi:hypothetical protein
MPFWHFIFTQTCCDEPAERNKRLTSADDDSTAAGRIITYRTDLFSFSENSLSLPKILTL